MIQDRMPERVRQVEFSEVQRTPTGLTRVVKASEACSLFLEKGCVVVRELVEEEGRKVVKSIALPLNSGLVRTIHLEDEVLPSEGKERCPGWPEGARAHVCERCNPEAVRKLNEEYRLASSPEADGASATAPVHPGGLAAAGAIVKGPPSGAPSAAEPTESEERLELVEQLEADGNPALRAVAERMEQQPSPALGEGASYQPTNAEEAILNRPRNRRR